MHPFEVLPSVVWEDLLEEVEDATDKVAIIKSHPALEALFEPKSQEWVFAAVIQIMLDTQNTWETPAVDRHVLSLRLVSKLVCKTVDKLLASRWDNYSDIPPEVYRLNTRGNFSEGDAIDRFLGEMENHPKNRSPLVNPFILFSIHIDGFMFWIMQEKQNKLLGKARPLKGLCFSLEATPLGFSENFLVLNRVFLVAALNLTPNLVQLTFVRGRLYNIGEDVFRELPRLEKFYFPKLPFLRSIKFGNLTQSHVHSLSLERYFPQLTRLSLKFDHWKEDYNKSANLFRKLQYLSVSNTSDNPPPFLASFKVAEYKQKLISICTIQAPNIKEFRFDLSHQGKEICKTRVLAAIDICLHHLNKRFEGKCNWKCIVIERSATFWQLTLSRTAESDVDYEKFEDWQRNKEEQAGSAIVKAGILSTGLVLLANEAPDCFVFCLPIFLAGLYNLM